MGGKAKKIKEPFWKKLDPELAEIAAHLGKTIDNMSLLQWAELLIYAGVAKVGYDATGDWKGSLAGVIALKLATTMGGTPPVSQSAGLATLAILGLKSISPKAAIPTPLVTA